MRDDIVGGLRNALDRGETLEQATQTFVNAGYNSTEVQEAAKYATGGTLSSLIHKPLEKTPEQKPIVKQLTKQISKQKSKSKTSWKAFLLVGLLLALVGVLILTLVFKEQLMNFLQTSLS